MALKPQRPCRHPGCPALTREGYCAAHKPKQSVRKESAAWHDWYALPVWKNDLRPGQLLREPFCRECARRGVRTRATDVDHIRDHKGVWARFIDRENLQSLCHSCHSRKTMREAWERTRKNSGKLGLQPTPVPADARKRARTRADVPAGSPEGT